MEPIDLLEQYLIHREDAPRPSGERRARRLLSEPVDQPLSQALADHQDEPAPLTVQIA